MGETKKPGELPAARMECEQRVVDVPNRRPPPPPPAMAVPDTLDLRALHPAKRRRLVKLYNDLTGWEPVGFTVNIRDDWFAEKHGNRERVVTADCVMTREEAEKRAVEERDDEDDGGIDVVRVLKKGDEYDTADLEEEVPVGEQHDGNGPCPLGDACPDARGYGAIHQRPPATDGPVVEAHAPERVVPPTEARLRACLDESGAWVPSRLDALLRDAPGVPFDPQSQAIAAAREAEALGCALAAFQRVSGADDAAGLHEAICRVRFALHEPRTDAHDDNEPLLEGAERVARARARAEERAAQAFREVAEGLERERLLRADLALVRTGTEGVWFWQGAGDEPGSLSCPVVMSAERLRAFVADRVRAEKAEKQRDKARAAVQAPTGDEALVYWAGVAHDAELARGRLAEGIAAAARRAGILREGVPLTGPMLLQLLDELGGQAGHEQDHTGSTVERCRHCGGKWVCPDCDGKPEQRCSCGAVWPAGKFTEGRGRTECPSCRPDLWGTVIALGAPPPLRIESPRGSLPGMATPTPPVTSPFLVQLRACLPDVDGALTLPITPPLTLRLQVNEHGVWSLGMATDGARQLPRETYDELVGAVSLRSDGAYLTAEGKVRFLGDMGDRAEPCDPPSGPPERFAI